MNNFRPHAAFLVVASGLVLVFVGATLQVVVWETRGFYRAAQFGTLPPMTDTFLDLFGHRPTVHLLAVVVWLWWPMVAAFAYCHQRYPDQAAFAVAFLYWFAICWLVAAVLLSLVVALCAYPALVLLLSGLSQPPRFMRLVNVVSWLLPLAVLTFAVVRHIYFRPKAREEIAARPPGEPGP